MTAGWTNPRNITATVSGSRSVRTNFRQVVECVRGCAALDGDGSGLPGLALSGAGPSKAAQPRTHSKS